MNCLRSKNLSLEDKSHDAVIKSWMAATTGSPFLGVTMLRFTFISSRASVLASSVCGTSGDAF